LAIVKNPLHSERASGSIADAITYLHTKRGAVAKRYSFPTGLPTADQLTVRAATKIVMGHWPTIHPRKRATWDEPAARRHLNPIALYMLENYPRQAAGQEIQDSYLGIDPPTLRDLILSRPSCIAYYPLNEAAGPFLDLKGGYNATTEGAIAFRQPSLQTADADPCASFAGTTGKATLTPTGAPFNFEYNTPFSISAIVRGNLPAVPDTHCAIFGKWKWSAPIKGYLASIDTALAPTNWQLRLTLYSNQAPLLALCVYTTTVFPNQVNTLVHTTYDGSPSPTAIQLYVNGRAQPKTTLYDSLGANSILHTIQPVLGSAPGYQRFNGSLDEVAIYTAALTPADCAADYAITQFP